MDLGDVELRDAAELVQWTKNQWFSNGKVAGGGLSYDGMLGLSMAAGGGVDAAISLFTPMDVMGELVAPGGMLCRSFLNDYTGLTSDFEHQGTPWRHMLRNPLQFPFHVLLGVSRGTMNGEMGKLHFQGRSFCGLHPPAVWFALSSSLPASIHSLATTVEGRTNNMMLLPRHLLSRVVTAVVKQTSDDRVQLLLCCFSSYFPSAARVQFSVMRQNFPMR